MRKAEEPIHDAPELPEGFFFRVKRDTTYTLPRVTVSIRHQGKHFSTEHAQAYGFTGDHPEETAAQLVTSLAQIAAEKFFDRRRGWTLYDEVAPFEGDHFDVD